MFGHTGCGEECLHGDRNDSSDPDPVSGGTLPVESAETEERNKKRNVDIEMQIPDLYGQMRQPFERNNEGLLPDNRNGYMKSSGSFKE